LRNPLKTLFRQQPPAFYMIFLLEIWERFGFYTVQGILTLYFIRVLGFDEKTAYYTFGAFSALVYGMISIGGYLGDKVLGTKRTIVLGLITLACGYLFLSLASREYVFLAIGLVCVGNGLFKANPSNLLAKCYKENDPRLHGGFTLYYMAINLGSIIALLMGPYLSSHYGYFYAFFMSFVGLTLALLNYALQRSYIAHINTPADARKIPLWKWNIIIIFILAATKASAYLLQHVMIAKNLVWAVVALATMTYFYYMYHEKRASRLKMLAALILMVEAIVFFTLYQQMPTSINLFAVDNVRPYLFGISIDPQSFQVLNPIWIIIISPLLAAWYQNINKRRKSFPVPFKFAFGMTLCSISFLFLFLPRYFPDPNGMVSSWWLVGSYLFQSTSELLISALGVAMVAELVPLQITGFVMGMWFLTSAVSGFIGAKVASYTALPKSLPLGVDSLQVYTEVFAYVGLGTLGLALIMWIIGPLLNTLISDRVTSK
jgi:POT family proton-dependent oligopeptide transporter